MQAEARLVIAVVRPGVACAGVSLLAFWSAAMNEATAALPPGEVSCASWVVSVARYVFRVAAALAVDSVASGARVVTTPELILLMIVQSAADGLVEELAAVEVAADADVAEADTDAAGVELDGELDELQPAMRAPLAASTARAESDERLDISGTSMGVERSVASHENLVLP
jgi:hypothetical protein